MDSSTVIAEPQHLRALDRANQVRLARAQLKRKVASGEVGASDVVLNSPWEAESMKISDLLISQRRWGRTRCRKFLLHLGISENKPIGDLTQRQRTALVTLLTDTSRAAEEIQVLAPYRDRRFAAV